MYSNISAVIYGCAGLTLSQEEKEFFTQANPFGFILFARNCDNPEQLKSLVTELKSCVNRVDVPILIDQEGGRVARLRPPHWRKSYAAAQFLSIKDANKTEEAIYLNARITARELLDLGINVNCAPILDLLFADAHDIIGDRAYGEDVNQVVRYATQVCKGFLEESVMPIIKHIPGHGRAKADSHLELPVVSASHEELAKTDFSPFKQMADSPWAMTAHIIYSAIDDQEPATTSHKMIDLIRNEIGFNGVLLSDDISMQALQGSFAERTNKILDAGCDIVLHCNGDMNEMQAIAGAARNLSSASIGRIEKANAMLQKPDNFNVARAEEQLQEILAG